MNIGFFDGSIGQPFDEWRLNFKNLNYVTTHLKHFSKWEAAIFELQADFESVYAWLKCAKYISI